MDGAFESLDVAGSPTSSPLKRKVSLGTSRLAAHGRLCRRGVSHVFSLYFFC